MPMRRAIQAPAGQQIALAATIAIVLHYCASTYAMPSVATNATTDDSSLKQKTRKNADRMSETDSRIAYVTVRIERPERITGFRVTISKEGKFKELTYIRAIPFRVVARRVDVWHDDFLKALEQELARFVQESVRAYGEDLWSALRYHSDPNASFRTFSVAYDWVASRIDQRLRTIHPPTEDEDGFTLMNGSPSSLSAGGLVVWERMRRRLIRGRSVVSKKLLEKGISLSVA